jgi:hypothetical protein
MTRMQEMSLDYHFKVEQEVGSSTYAFFGFNGKTSSTPSLALMLKHYVTRILCIRILCFIVFQNKMAPQHKIKCNCINLPFAHRLQENRAYSSSTKSKGNKGQKSTAHCSQAKQSNQRTFRQYNKLNKQVWHWLVRYPNCGSHFLQKHIPWGNR